MEPLGAQVCDWPSEGGRSVLRGTARALPGMLCSQNHSQYKKKANARTKGRRYNFFTALSSHPFLQGAPASWWNHLHFQHHAKPNCFRKDPDVNMHPLFFALGKTLSVEVRPGEGWEVMALEEEKRSWGITSFHILNVATVFFMFFALIQSCYGLKFSKFILKVKKTHQNCFCKMRSTSRKWFELTCYFI